jgi:hypothetical protein
MAAIQEQNTSVEGATSELPKIGWKDSFVKNRAVDGMI